MLAGDYQSNPGRKGLPTCQAGKDEGDVMSMGSDTAHDADTLRIHHDVREQHLHLAGIKAIIAAARGIEPDLPTMDAPFFGRWCDTSQPRPAP